MTENNYFLLNQVLNIFNILESMTICNFKLSCSFNFNGVCDNNVFCSFQTVINENKLQETNAKIILTDTSK